MPAPPFEHKPVLVAPLLRLLNPQPGDEVLDGTVGLGGHAAALLPRILPGGRYVGLDVDESMINAARARLAGVTEAGLDLVVASYVDFPDVLARLGLGKANHMLLDLGVNTAQLADPSRGFSFDLDGPLDMRYDRRAPRLAVDLVNRLTERELADLFYHFGQETLSRKIAKRICQVRHSARITTTRVLAQAVESAVAPRGGLRTGKIHPATRVFQALRIAINRELENLEAFLGRALDYLLPGGKLAVISFQSLEDGIVKRCFRTGVANGLLRELTKRPVVVDPDERRANPRSRSAKLRVAERI